MRTTLAGAAVAVVAWLSWLSGPSPTATHTTGPQTPTTLSVHLSTRPERTGDAQRSPQKARAASTTIRTQTSTGSTVESTTRWYSAGSWASRP